MGKFVTPFINVLVDELLIHTCMHNYVHEVSVVAQYIVSKPQHRYSTICGLSCYTLYNYPPSSCYQWKVECSLLD